MGQITIAPNFFRNEIRNYANASSAFWRELFQNAIDAGATKIEIKTEARPKEEGEQVIRVTFADNGRGMERAVIEEVFLCMGATTKSSDSIGGFGKARILLCYAMERYEVRTQNIRLSGRGANYELSEREDYFAGCQFTIDVLPSALSIFGKEDLEAALREFLSRCHLRAAVTLNGVLLGAYTPKGRLARALSFGGAYVNKSGSARRENSLLVRVDGVLMFEKSIQSSPQVVVELFPETSRDYLLSNRDSLNYLAGYELDKFCQELSIDTQSALRERKPEREVFEGRASLWTNARQREKQNLTIAREAKGGESIVKAFDSSPMQAKRMSEVQGGEGEDFEVCFDVVIQDPLLEGFVFLLDAQTAQMRKIAKMYHPAQWGDGKGVRRRKLFGQWNIAVDAALDALGMYCDLKHIAWRAGFIFSEEAQAAREKQEDNTHAFLLNPLWLMGDKDLPEAGSAYKMRYGLRDYASHVRLVTLAAHESCHVICGFHDESFASLFTDVCAYALADMENIHKKMIAFR